MVGFARGLEGVPDQVLHFTDNQKLLIFFAKFYPIFKSIKREILVKKKMEQRKLHPKGRLQKIREECNLTSILCYSCYIVWKYKLVCCLYINHPQKQTPKLILPLALAKSLPFSKTILTVNQAHLAIQIACFTSR